MDDVKIRLSTKLQNRLKKKITESFERAISQWRDYTFTSSQHRYSDKSSAISVKKKNKDCKRISRYNEFPGIPSIFPRASRKIEIIQSSLTRRCYK